MYTQPTEQLQVENNFRYERKFMVPKSVPLKELVAVTKTNSAFFREVFHERQVNNIYFDTEEYKFYFDNVDGVSNRQKARIRWYGDAIGGIKKPKLEIKLKQGLVGDKWTFGLDPFVLDDALNSGKLKKLFLQSRLPAPIFEMVIGLKPTLINAYSRRYFISADEKFRITLDYDIEYRAIYKNNNNFNRRPALETSNVVELKYGLNDDKKASEISRQFPFRLSKNSKYVNGLNHFQSFPE